MASTRKQFYHLDWCVANTPAPHVNTPQGRPCYTVSSIVEADVVSGTPLMAERPRAASREGEAEDWRFARVQTYPVGGAGNSGGWEHAGQLVVSCLSARARSWSSCTSRAGALPAEQSLPNGSLGPSIRGSHGAGGPGRT